MQANLNITLTLPDSWKEFSDAEICQILHSDFLRVPECWHLQEAIDCAVKESVETDGKLKKLYAAAHAHHLQMATISRPAEWEFKRCE